MQRNFTKKSILLSLTVYLAPVINQMIKTIGNIYNSDNKDCFVNSKPIINSIFEPIKLSISAYFFFSTSFKAFLRQSSVRPCALNTLRYTLKSQFFSLQICAHCHEQNKNYFTLCHKIFINHNLTYCRYNLLPFRFVSQMTYEP